MDQKNDTFFKTLNLDFPLAKRKMFEPLSQLHNMLKKRNRFFLQK